MISKIKMNKKFYMIIIILLFIMSCFEQKSNNLNKEIKLIAWVTYKGPEYKEFLILSKEFTNYYRKKTGKVVIIVPKRVPFDDLITNIKMACMTKKTPDIARVDVNKILELAYHKVLVKLDLLPNFDAKSIDEKAKSYMKIPFYTNVVETKNKDGKWEKHLYGLPEQPTCIALFWNRDIFRKFSLELKEKELDPKRAPKDWDEFIKYAKVFTQKKDGVQYYGFAMNNSFWWTLPFFGCFKAKIISKDKNGKKICLFGDKFTTAALQFKVDLYRKYKVEAGAWQPGSMGPEIGFVNGKYAMILMGPWNVEKFYKQGLNFGVSLIPSISKRQANELGIKDIPKSATNIGGNNFVIFKTCKYKTIAYDFINYMTSRDVQLKWCLSLKQIPSNKGTAEILLGEKKYKGRRIEADPIIKIFMKQIQYAVLPPQVPRYGYVECDIVNPEMELALKGEKEVKEALLEAGRKIEEKILSLINE